MDKQQQLKIALPVLVIVMAFVWGPIIMGSGKKKDSSVQNINQVSQDKENGVDLVAMSRAGIRNKSRTTHSEWGQNPFMLTKPPKAIAIEGILWDATNPQAIINGDMHGVGGVIESKTIVEIKPNSVIIKSKSGEDVELKLGEEKQF